MKERLIGIDIGGTKCAITYGHTDRDILHLLDEDKFPTTTVDETIANIITSVEQMLIKHKLTRDEIAAIGISCGGPLDSQTGLIMSPPNLPGWDGVPIVDKIRKHFEIRTGLQNDANACALAEWKFGAGRGAQNMVFMTFGTGLGAGLILNGKLYSGTNDNAGELGRIRLSEFGPVGYGKAGSFEGFCSGGGIAQIAHMLITAKHQMGIAVNWCNSAELNQLTAQKIAEQAQKGDELALKIFEISSRKLGQGLSIIIDMLNPETIVIGGIYTRCRSLMEAEVQKIIEQETLPNARKVCRVLPSELGEQIGSYSALSVAVDILTKNN
ncbi:ROK family protein [Niabella aquatica]